MNFNHLLDSIRFCHQFRLFQPPKDEEPCCCCAYRSAYCFFKCNKYWMQFSTQAGIVCILTWIDCQEFDKHILQRITRFSKDTGLISALYKVDVYTTVYCLTFQNSRPWYFSCSHEIRIQSWIRALQWPWLHICKVLFVTLLLSKPVGSSIRDGLRFPVVIAYIDCIMLIALSVWVHLGFCENGNGREWGDWHRILWIFAS